MGLAQLAGGVLKLGLGGLALDIGRQRVDLLPQLPQRLGGAVRHQLRLPDAPFLRVLAELRRVAQLAKELVRRLERLFDREQRRRLPEGTQQALLGPRVVEPLEIEAHPRLADPQAELDGGDLLDRVGFVEHHEIVREQEAGRLFLRVLAGVHQGEEQRVVDHDQLGIGRRLARFLEEAIPPRSAVAGGADVGLGADLQPDLHRRLELQIAQRAVPRSLGPAADLFELVALGGGEEVPGLLEGAAQARRAEVVLAPFQQHRRQLLAEQLADDRDVLPDQLLLEVDRVGRNDRLAAGLQRVAGRGNQVGEGFPDPGARFGDQAALFHQRLRHRHRELLLFGAEFEIARLRQAARVREREADLLDEGVGQRLSFQG